MSNIEHLFENALSWLENGWNMSEFGKDKVNHELLGYVDASKEEIIAMARYVFNTRCAWCDEKKVIKCDDCEKCGDETECPLLSLAGFTDSGDYCSLAVRVEES